MIKTIQRLIPATIFAVTVLLASATSNALFAQSAATAASPQPETVQLAQAVAAVQPQPATNTQPAAPSGESRAVSLGLLGLLGAFALVGPRREEAPAAPSGARVVEPTR